MSRQRLLLAALALACLSAIPQPASAGSGGPDTFGYRWRDINDPAGCPVENDAPPSGVPPAGGSGSFGAGAYVIGPVNLGFSFPFYDRIVTQVWFQQAGLVCFQAPPNTNLYTNQPIPNNDTVSGFIAAHWAFQVAESPAVVWESDATNGVFRAQFNYSRVQNDTSGLPLTFQVYLYRSGDIRIEYLEPAATTNVTIGLEGWTQSNAQALQVRYNGTQSGGLTYGTPTPFAICFRFPKNLSCAGAQPISCDSTTNGTSPANIPSNALTWGCGSGSWAGKEKVYQLTVSELSDIQISLAGTGTRFMAAYLLRSCDEYDCVAGGTSSFSALTVPPGTYYLAVDALAARDEGAFTLNVSCTALSDPIACTESLSDTTIGQPGRLDGYPCIPAADFGGAEQFYSVDFVPPGNLNVSLAGGVGQGVFILDATQPLTPAACLEGGVGGAVLFDPPAGTYLIAVDGPTGGDAPYTVTLNCQPELSCVGSTPIACQQSLSGSTVGATPRADFYRCADQQFSGPEAVYEFTVTATETASFVLDTTNPDLDLILLDSCNEGACVELGDSAISKELLPGTYYIVVDGKNGASGDFTLSAICGFGLEPAYLSVTGAEGECFTEHKRGWLTPELVQADIFFSIDLTGSMSGVRNQFMTNMTDIIDELQLYVQDVAFGLASYKDYNGTFTTTRPCSYTQGYGGGGDYPYLLHQPITTDRTVIEDAVNNLPPVGGGGDSPESYNRLLYEAIHDPVIAWRPGSRRLVVDFGDEMPHDCNVLECLGGVGSPLGIDPGPDNIIGNADDLLTMNLVQEFIDNDMALLHLTNSPATNGGYTYNEIWDCWAERTGGDAAQLNSDGTVPASLGMTLAELVAELVRAQGSFCRELTLKAEPGYENWVSFVGPVYNDQQLPASVEFDITFCVPPGTPPGAYDFLVNLMCGDSVVTSQQVHVDVTRDCAATVVSPPSDVTICEGDTTTLDATGMSLVNCAGMGVYSWRDGLGNVVGSAATLDVSPPADETYTVSLTCSADPACEATVAVDVTVEHRPEVGNGLVVDPQTCRLGLELSWDEATFPSGNGYYNVYRSETSCADALTRPPINGPNLAGSTYVDSTTRQGRTYYYAIQAEDLAPSVACRPAGPNHGGIVSATTVCLGPITDVDDGGFPDYLGWTLRVHHVGQQVTLDWTGTRVLLPGEHFHVLKGTDPRVLGMVNPEAQLTLTHVETDTSARVQFFDVRIADACEEMSLDDEPQGWDMGR